MIENMITLAIETAIRGGGLSLIIDEREIDFWNGNKDVSKAEDVLEQISNLLKRNKVKKIDLIAVSKEPGSSTGIRIGLATALGLKRSFNCEIVSVSVFEALINHRTLDGLTLLAIPVGSRQIAWQTFDKDTSCQQSQNPEIEIGNKTSFQTLLNNQKYSKIILHNELTEFTLTTSKKNETGQVEIMNDKFAKLIGLQARSIKSKHSNSN